MLHYVWKNKAYIMIWHYKSNKTLSITICHLDIILKTALYTIHVSSRCGLRSRYLKTVYSSVMGWPLAYSETPNLA